MKYKIFYQLNNHKFQETIIADNAREAKNILSDRILRRVIINKLTVIDEPEDGFEQLKNIFGIK